MMRVLLKCIPLPGEEAHHLLHLREGGMITDWSQLGGAAFLCTWSKSLACCFSHFAVHRSHLQILIPVGRVCGVRAPGFRGCKGTTL